MKHILPSPGPARKDEWGPALGLLFQHLDADDRQVRIDNALELLRLGQLDAEGLLVIRDRKTVLGAMLCAAVPGAGGLVWPPQAQAGDQRRAVEDQLVTSGLAWFRRGRAKLVQALLDSSEVSLAEPLQRNGFRRVTTLSYLRHNLEVDASLLEEDGQLTFTTYPDNPDLFQETLSRTYDGTLDCPEVNGVRTIEEVIEGHKSQGKHRPEYWWLAWSGGQPAGVLLTAEVPEWNSWELSYLGVLPQFRGRGLGRVLTRKAILEARTAEVCQLTLSVDQRNVPALRVYKNLGFLPYQDKEVYLALCGEQIIR